MDSVTIRAKSDSTEISQGGKFISPDVEALSTHHEFVRNDKLDEKELHKKWESRMARRYYDKLYKEYVVADMRLYRLGKLGLRWRTKKDVLAGIGSDVCGALSCGSCERLKTFEVPFQYAECGCVKSELVKLRICRGCSEKMEQIRLITRQCPKSPDSKKRKRGDEFTI